MSTLQSLHDELVKIENTFHMLAEPERLVAEKVREFVKGAAEEFAALKLRVEALEHTLSAKPEEPPAPPEVAAASAEPAPGA